MAVQPKPSPRVELPATLQPGSEGTELLDLQEGLAALGYDVGGADGVSGSATANAVAAFQSAEGLPVDGVMGPSTRDALGTVVATRLREEAEPIREGLDAAVQSGAVTEADASELGSRLDRMVADAAKIPPALALYVPVVLRDAAAQSSELTRSRALALLGRSTQISGTSAVTPSRPSASTPATQTGSPSGSFRTTGFSSIRSPRSRVSMCSSRTTSVRRSSGSRKLSWIAGFPPGREQIDVGVLLSRETAAPPGGRLRSRRRPPRTHSHAQGNCSAINLSHSPLRRHIEPYPLGSRGRSAAESGSVSTASATSRS